MDHKEEARLVEERRVVLHGRAIHYLGTERKRNKILPLPNAGERKITKE